MTKTNLKDTSVLDSLGGSASKDAGTQIPFLAINIASEDSEGKEIPVKTFTIVGSGKYSKEVKFRPLAYYNKLIAMKQDEKKNWKTTNETIFYADREQPIDARGGIGCGRLLGKSVPDSWTEDQRKANKAKANYYGFLFGLVEFPGEKPMLCNFRVPAGKAMQVSNALSEIKAMKRSIYSAMLKMSLATNPKDRASPHPVLTIELDVSKELPASGLTDDANVIKDYVAENNARIRESHQGAKLARNSLRSDVTIMQEIEEDSDIPF